VAQWLAQGTHNSLVAGSNPAGPTLVFLKDATQKVKGNMQLNVSDWVLVSTTLFLGIIALLAPTVSEGIKKRFFAPKVLVTFEEASPYCHKTFWRSQQQPDLNEPVYYFKFRVENIGYSQVKRCEAVLEELWIYNSADRPEKLSGFVGVNLKWADVTQILVTSESSSVPLPSLYVDINPRRLMFCNIGHLSSLKWQKESEASIFHDIPGTHKAKSRFLFEQLVHPHSQPNCLVPGKYAIKITLYSENAPVQEEYFQIAWSGNWQANETDMFRELTIARIPKPI
jgi:hypothetical protein